MPEDVRPSIEKDMLSILFQHNLWANLKMFDTCLALNDIQLNHSDPGTYGSIKATLTHLVRSEERYLFFLTGQEHVREAEPSMAELRERVRQSGQALIQVATGIQPDTQARVGEQAELMPASIVLLQTIHHCNEHRTHIATLLGQLGITPPPLSGWDFYDEEILGIKNIGSA
ncbi:MAG TPA: DinB family protein [Anaerolineales bacterium]|nr:DinB family protein [Anaerolineales bacterium]